jgi:hypothetical protein
MKLTAQIKAVSIATERTPSKVIGAIWAVPDVAASL